MAIHLFMISIWLYCLIWWQGKNGMGTRESEQLKNLSMKIQEVTSNVAVTVKKKKTMHVRLTGIPSGIFRQNYLWYGFTDEPVTSSIRCSSCRKYFCRWFQINDRNIDKYKWSHINFDAKLFFFSFKNFFILF